MSAAAFFFADIIYNDLQTGDIYLDVLLNPSFCSYTITTHEKAIDHFSLFGVRPRGAEMARALSGMRPVEHNA